MSNSVIAVDTFSYQEIASKFANYEHEVDGSSKEFPFEGSKFKQGKKRSKTFRIAAQNILSLVVKRDNAGRSDIEGDGRHGTEFVQFYGKEGKPELASILNIPMKLYLFDQFHVCEFREAECRQVSLHILENDSSSKQFAGGDVGSAGNDFQENSYTVTVCEGEKETIQMNSNWNIEHIDHGATNSQFVIMRMRYTKQMRVASSHFIPRWKCDFLLRTWLHSRWLNLNPDETLQTGERTLRMLFDQMKKTLP